ncbi:MAG: HDIG domain-containing protein [Anaerolineae bacterium]|nr:HDIG domain-containing protein [Anaerolineae bacterium]
MRRVNHRWWAWVRLILLGLVLAGISGVVMVLPLLPTEQVVIEAGGVVPRDISAPRRVSYESAILTAEQQERAAASVQPVYTSPDDALARQQFDRARQVLDYLGSVRADTLASPAQKRALIKAAPDLADLPADMIDNLLGLSDDGWNRVEHETLRVVGVAMRSEVREDRLVEILEEQVPDLISLDLSDEETVVAVALVQSFVVPNSSFDPQATADARERAREGVGAVLRTFEAGQVIVREGEIVEPLDIEVMDQLGLRQPQTSWTDFAGAILLAMLGTVLLFLYLARFQSEVLWSGQRLLLLVSLLSVFVLGEGLMLPGGEILRYLSPAPAMAILAVATLGPHAGVATAFFLGGVAGMIADNSLEVVTYTVLGGVVAALTLGRVERISALFRAGAFAALTHVLIVLVFYLPQDSGVAHPSGMLVAGLAGIANGGISASLALGGLFLIGPLFDIVTTMRLIELSRPDHPLLQQLLREAPATYHHSLMVASLAEQAAERIGADALLTRVGSYYHDVGKITRPYFFAENQLEGVNPHDRLDPRTSAEVIVSHVKDGVDMARRYRLPRRVRDFVPEHHGTSWVSFLYDKAVQLAGDTASIDADDFRYQGPKPQSKETALVMLADGCEAAVRAMRPTSAEEVEEIVSRVFFDRISDSQLSECDLTLRDVESAREAFISALKGVFHPRIQYPRSEGGANA